MNLKLRESYPVNEMPQEKLLHSGIDALTDSDLLAAIIRTGTKKRDIMQLSKRIIAGYTLAKLASMDARELSKIEGLGIVKAVQITAAAELGRRTISASVRKSNRISCPADAVRLLVPKMKFRQQEQFVTVLLDSRLMIIKTEVVHIGTLNSSLVHPREIFLSAIKANADKMIIMHNHPSGCPEPSPEDIRITDQLIKGSRIIGIPIVDHIIVGDKTYFSMKEQGTIDF